MENLNKALASKIHLMTHSELYHAMYTDELTGLHNRRAFNEISYKYLALVDMDSLKWINDNLGFRAGDNVLCLLGRTLVSEFGPNRVFRIAGDEFVVVGWRRQEIASKLGTAYTTFPSFSWGLGEDLVKADTALKSNKQERLRMGRRVPRGEEPPWIDSIVISDLAG